MPPVSGIGLPVVERDKGVMRMGRLTPASVAAILLVAACGGSTESLAFPTSTRPVLLRTHAAIPACAGTPRGKPECGALVQKLGFQSATPAGWSPAELESAYDLPSRTKGAGQIVAVVDAYDNPNVASDLAEYRSAFGLPTANFTKYNQNGQMRNYPKGNKGWGTQIDQDVEMVSLAARTARSIWSRQAQTRGLILKPRKLRR